MSKSLIPSKVRHCAAAVVGLLLSMAAVFAAAPDAFAMRPLPTDDSGTAGTAVPVAAHSGMPGWEIALIAIGAVMVIGLLVAAVLRRHAAAGMQRAVS